jgi:5,10-methylenetetrahydromethanopterin reductase
MRIGLGIGSDGRRPVSFDELISQAQRAEQAGFASVWIPNNTGIDALTAATVCGRQTQRIEIGTAVVPTFVRHPYAMAQQALSVHAAIGHRLVLGIGLSHAIVIEDSLGLSYRKSYSHMKDYLAVLAPLMREGRVHTTQGQFRVHARLDIAVERACPLVIAALAPKMLALAGQLADGTITWMTGPKTLADHTVPRIREAAAAAQRPAPRVIAAFPISVTDDAERARRVAAQFLEPHAKLPSYRAMLEREGGNDLASVAIVGDEETVRRQLRALQALGVTDLLAAPFRGSRDEGSERTWTLLAAWMREQRAACTNPS